MSLLDRALIEVNSEACKRVAGWLASHRIPPDSEETSLVGLTPLEIGDFYLFLVAICHQTTPIGMPPLVGIVGGRERRGWDYLLGRFEELVRADRSLVSSARWRDVSAGELTAMFRDQAYGARLVETERRAELIRDLAEVMARNRWAHLEDLFELAGGRIASGDPNLVGLLSRFKAYRDPVNKKAFYLLALMRNYGIWSYRDPENLGPPVDYHEVRGHLRLGTVRIIDAGLRSKLLARRPVDESEDVAIRKAVFQAITEISARSRIFDPSRLHYLFWNVFRSCCQRGETHCDECPPSCPLPDRYVPLATGPDGRACPFRSVCEAARLPERRKIVEHVVASTYDFH